jgi:hypothetical protein
LARVRLFVKVTDVIGALRFIGILNAAVWLGAAFFFTLSVGPSFFSPEMIQVLGRPHAGAAVQVVLKRYFMFQYCCAGIAILHLLIEWLYTGRPLQKLRMAMLVSLLLLSLLGGIWFQPRLQRLHLEVHGIHSLPAQVEKARKSFGIWHGASQFFNLITLAGLLVHLWQVTHASDAPRFLNPTKFTLESLRG